MMQIADDIESRIELGKRLKRRDPAALERLYEDTFDDIDRFVGGRVLDRDRAEDLVQDIYLSLYRALPSYDVKRPLQPWVMTIARNKLRDRWRKEGRRGKAVDLEDLGEPESREGSPDLNLERSELAEQMQRAVSLLPEGMRSVVDLRLREGLSFDQIGTTLESTPVAVRKRYSRGLSLLRDRIRAAV